MTRSRTDPSQFVKSSEIARDFGVSVSTVLEWRNQGALPQPIKIGNGSRPRLYWPRAQYERWKFDKLAGAAQAVAS